MAKVKFRYFQKNLIFEDPRVKTTPLRRQTETNRTTSNSDKENNETVKEQQNLQFNEKKDKLNSSDSAIDNPKLNKLSI